MVYLATKNLDLDRVVEIADGCQGTPWWCLALQGYAKHHAFSGSGGEEMASALRSASPGASAWDRIRIPEAGDRGVNCEWTDITPLLSDTLLLADYAGTGMCGDRTAFEERFWWLADPMWSVPGNVRLDEHLARNIQARLRDEILRVAPDRFWQDPDGDPNDPRSRVTYHTRDAHNELLRTGAWNSWRSIPFSHSRYGRRLSYSANGSLIGDTAGVWRDHYQVRERYRIPYTNGGYSFTPDLARFRDPMSSTSADWAVTWNQGHERMIIPAEWHNLNHQTAVLRRADSLLIVAAARLPPLAESANASPAVALALGRPVDLHLEVEPASVDDMGVARAASMVRDGEWVASIEVRGDDWSGRARHGAPAPVLTDGFGLSTPVLTEEPRESPVGSPLRDVLLPSSDLASRARVGVYFEVYGVASDELLNMRISLESPEANGSLLSRIGRALRLVSGPSSTVRLELMQPADLMLPGVSSHHLVIDAGSRSPGVYELVVEVERASGSITRSSTPIRINRSALP
jgi:hypothetical protein